MSTLRFVSWLSTATCEISRRSAPVVQGPGAPGTKSIRTFDRFDSASPRSSPPRYRAAERALAPARSTCEISRGTRRSSRAPSVRFAFHPNLRQIRQNPERGLHRGGGREFVEFVERLRLGRTPL